MRALDKLVLHGQTVRQLLLELKMSVLKVVQRCTSTLYPHDLLTNDGQADPVVFGGALSEVHSAGELA